MTKFHITNTSGKHAVWLFIGDGQRLRVGERDTQKEALGLMAQFASDVNDAAFRKINELE